MATLLLSAAGAAVGNAVGGTVLGMSMGTVGRFLGASLGRVLDQRVLGQGAEAVETGRIERLRINAAGEGQAMSQVYGRMRVGGHVIWATNFLEYFTESGGSSGGKGRPATPKTREYHYRVSLAIALCEGEIAGVNRVWADGQEIPIGDLNMTVHPGSDTQAPDPLIEAVEGAGSVPAYRGTAYVVLENLELGQFGNRVPQFSFEVARPEMVDVQDVPALVNGVALIPGTGEYSLATTPVYMNYGSADGGVGVANVNSPSEDADFNTSLAQMNNELPKLKASSLIVSWFGNNLSCSDCTIKPKIEQREFDSTNMPWSVSSMTRAAAELVPRVDNRPIYGGTPTDQSVIQSIQRMSAEGLAVMYYPFILMDQLGGNGLGDPWSDNVDQAPLPWRGRITLDKAPGQAGSVDGTAAADAQVAAFFGTASAAHFGVAPGVVSYFGPNEWSYRRFILHQAALCAAAGGVDAFCIGSEMRSLTQIRGANGFPAVQALIALAAECRAILGPNVKIGYAADWSEYFGYHPQDGSGDVYFHLDPLWSDANIDFVGIDNYMPLSDWRDGEEHLDAEWGSDHNPDYLRANIEGGEGYDWYYTSPEGRDAQRREPIVDGSYGEDWVWRYKDIRSWWDNLHYDRSAGVHDPNPTGWMPRSKPIWFTELGCAAVNKGANQPNKFLDPKSSESSLPYYSNGLRDEAIQHAYLQATLSYWGDPANNPESDVYAGRMLDMNRAFIWAWDARPYPWFPANDALWSDGPNYERGHWINGRAAGRSLASVVSEICRNSGLTEIDTTELFGFVRGYVVPQVSDGRKALQPLMLTYGFDAVERDGVLVFKTRSGKSAHVLNEPDFALHEDVDGLISETRAAEAEMVGRVRIGFIQADADHQVVSEEAVLPDDATHGVAENDLSLALTRGEGRQTAERWLAEGRIARDTMRFALPPSHLKLGAGDIVDLPTESGRTLARIDRVEMTDRQLVDAVRIEPDVYEPTAFIPSEVSLSGFAPAVPVSSWFMDLPLMSGNEDPIAPHLAASSEPWPGSVAVFAAAQDDGYALNSVLNARSVVGVTETDLTAAQVGLIDRGAPLEVNLASGTLESVSEEQLLAGANLMAIGDGSAGNWELFQFQTATLIEGNRWALSKRLRGQAGSDGLMPQTWPAGSRVVLMNGAPGQIDLSSANRRVARHYRVGPADRPYSDTTYTHVVHAFDGNGLRPYRPAHLKLRHDAGDLHATWIRRTRLDGDSWELFEVPLSEENESYLVRIRDGASIVREEQVSSPSWIYTSAQQTADGVGPGAQIEVAQISAQYGPGLFARAALE